jgi:VIT1/CCC1 family predicted Fe2+/Mn2+ transporter
MASIVMENVHISGGGFVRDIVFGMNDGLLSMLSLVSGVAASGAGGQIVILAGIAGAAAGAISMAAGAYISTKSQIEFYEEEIAREKREIETLRGREVKEIRDIYSAKGFRGELLAKVVGHITSDKARWLDVMMKEELGLFADRLGNPWYAGALSGSAFVLGSLFPVVPFVLLDVHTGLVASIVATGLAMFGVGVVKARYTKANPFLKGGEMVLIGLIGAGATYLVGSLFHVNA